MWRTESGPRNNASLDALLQSFSSDGWQVVFADSYGSSTSVAVTARCGGVSF